MPFSLKDVQDAVHVHQHMGVCTGCEMPVTNFKDRESINEFRLSGLCQKCQDRFFNGEE